MPNANDRPNVRFTGGNVLYSWSPALGLSGTTIEDPSLTTSVLANNVPTEYILTVTDPLSGCSKSDTITVTSSTTPLDPLVSVVGDSVFCQSGDVTLRVSGTSGDFQWQISWDFKQEKIGKTYKCVIDRKEGQYFIGRTEFDSPDVDNEVLIDASQFYLKTGEFAQIKIIDHSDKG